MSLLFFNEIMQNESDAVRSLKNNKDIVISRADKGGGTVIMDRADYMSKLDALISKGDKFKECKPNQTTKVKNKINKLVASLKDTDPYLHNSLKRVGDFDDGYLYGLPKVHKNETNPPLRPVISMTGTVTHSIAQKLNEIIRQYLNDTYIIKSSTELILKLDSLKVNNISSFYSLDVESLFTNVPVKDTIDIIIENVYQHPTIDKPPIPKEMMKELLLICTTETPFQFNGKSYVQLDGVSMGSPLGPTFADF